MKGDAVQSVGPFCACTGTLFERRDITRKGIHESEKDSRDAEGEERSSARARAGALGKGRRRIGDEEREKERLEGKKGEPRALLALQAKCQG